MHLEVLTKPTQLQLQLKLVCKQFGRKHWRHKTQVTRTAPFKKW